MGGRTAPFYRGADGGSEKADDLFKVMVGSGRAPRPLDSGYGLVFLSWDSFRAEGELGSKRLGWMSRDFNKCQLLSQAT